MRRTISAFSVAIVLAVMCLATAVPAQAQTAGERFGIGCSVTRTARLWVWPCAILPSHRRLAVCGGAPAAAQAANQTGIPGDVMSIIEQWDAVGPKIKQIAAHVGPLIDTSRPPYVHDYQAVDVLAPLVPRLALFGFGNYRRVLNEPDPVDQRPAPSIPGWWERSPDDDRPVNPRIFHDPQHAGRFYRRRGAGGEPTCGRKQRIRVRV